MLGLVCYKSIGDFIPSSSDLDFATLAMYGLSVVFLLLAIWVAIKAAKVRRSVCESHKQNQALVEQFERAIGLLYEPDDNMVIVGLQDLWALCDPRFYPDLNPILTRLKAHQNSRIAAEAEATHKKLVESLLEVGPNTPP